MVHSEWTPARSAALTTFRASAGFSSMTTSPTFTLASSQPRPLRGWAAGRSRLGRGEARRPLLAQGGVPLHYVWPEEGEHLVGGRLVEGRPGGAQPVVQAPLGQPDGLLRARREV